MVDTNTTSEEAGQGKSEKSQKSKGTKNTTDKGETKQGFFGGLVDKVKSKFEGHSGTPSSSGTTVAPKMWVNWSLTGSSKSSTLEKKAHKDDNSEKRGSAASSENAIASRAIVGENKTGQGEGSASKIPLSRTKVTEDELESTVGGSSAVKPGSTSSKKSIPLPNDHSKEEGALQSPPTGLKLLRPSEFPISPPQGKPFNYPSHSGLNKPTSISARNTSNREAHARNSDSHTQNEQPKIYSDKMQKTFPGQTPPTFSDPPTQGKPVQGPPQDTPASSPDHRREKKSSYPALPPTQFNGQQKEESGVSPMEVDEDEQDQTPALSPTKPEHTMPIGDIREPSNMASDHLAENWPRPLPGHASQVKPLVQEGQQSTYPPMPGSSNQEYRDPNAHIPYIPTPTHGPTHTPMPANVPLVPANYDTNGRGTYTPTETYVSEQLWRILETPGDEYKAIFFSRYISPLNPPLPPLKPFNLDPDKWKSNDHFAPVPFASEKRWGKIVRELTSLKNACGTERPRKIGARVASAVTSYCREADGYDFEILDGRNISKHVVATIPIIVDQALMLPSLLAKQIPILEGGQSKTIFVSKKLCCSLLANAFFSTFPPQRSNMPDINFHRLFSTSSSESRSDVKAEKIMCILNYFHQITAPRNQEQFGNNIISYARRHQTQTPDWETLKGDLINVVVEPSKKIEEMDGMLQVDFANKVVGGGVLNDGAIMEEILFVISPELIVSRLFTETLDDNEVLVITGAHQFSEYEGYSASFAYKKPYHFNNVNTDNLNRLFTQMVAMDALHFKGDPKEQFRRDLIDRELQKSFVGFGQGPELNRPVATGNWGCGAFNGDTELKFLIQWLAATVAGRPEFHYHTVGDKQQASAMEEAMDLLKSHNVDSGKLYKLLVNFYSDRFDYSSIFQFIRDMLEDRFKTSL